MGGLSMAPNVRSSDARPVIIPGPTQMPANVGNFLKVNAAGTGYELGPAGGGGAAPIGVAQLNADTATINDNTGAGALNYSGITYQISDPYSGGSRGAQPPISDWLALNYNRIEVAAGWYHPIVYLDLAWPTGAVAPDWFTPLMQAGWDLPHGAQTMHTAVTSNYSDNANPRRGISQVFDFGPVFMEPGRAFGGGSYDYFSFELRWGPSSDLLGNNAKGLRGTTPQLSWTIYRLG